jgi:hypothetical protein
MKWLTKDSDIFAADEESLKAALLTSDGMGKTFKEKCLEELLSRESDKGWNLGCETRQDR